jgi:hypothetical protein
MAVLFICLMGTVLTAMKSWGIFKDFTDVVVIAIEE